MSLLELMTVKSRVPRRNALITTQASPLASRRPMASTSDLHWTVHLTPHDQAPRLNAIQER